MRHRHPPSRALVRLIAAGALSLLMTACGGGSTADGLACTAEARPSVLLTVVDPQNAPLAGVTASFQVNGGSAQSQACDANGLCALAFELAGEFSISASKAGYLPASGTLRVSRDDCHVITARLTLTLRPAG
jgi:hypothetical protein